MMTPLLHLDLPDAGAGDPAHFALIQIVLEAVCRANEWLIRYYAKQGLPVPPLYMSGVRYASDPPGHEDWRTCISVLARGKGDCMPLSTLVLRDDYEFTPLVSLSPGDRIMGDGAWTEVREAVFTGEKEILEFTLSNGCALRCSHDHRLFRDVDGRTEEVQARDVRVGDDLLQLDRLPLAGADGFVWPEPMRKLDETTRSWLLGVFIADGWTQPYRSAISGRDGKPKEAQKRRAQEAFRSIGVHTRWHERYLAINDKEIAQFFAACGLGAPNKHLPSMRFASENAVRAAIEGLAADSGVTGNSDTRVYGTTSPKLALQLRALYRMLGIGTGIRRVDDHGGLGKHPIYRVTPREKTREGYAERREKKFARVRSISDGGIEICADIETDSGKFWCPESDVIVHNCDNLVAWRVGELWAAGIACEPVLKWQWVPRSKMIELGYPAKKLPKGGVWLTHCLVRYADGAVEDPSKELGMGGNFMESI